MDSNRLQRIEMAMCQWLFRLEAKSEGHSFFGSVEEKQGRALSRFTLFQLAESLKLDRQIDQSNESEMRLRLALHFCPREAIAWDPLRPDSRVDVIARHLEEAFHISGPDVEAVSRDIASILGNWEARRKSLSSKAGWILEKQGGRCATCRVTISEERMVEEEGKMETERDHFKPYFEEPGVRTWLAAKVDHIVPVSAQGTNRRDNLQVLCKLCNSGKANDIGVTVFQELKHACMEVWDVSPQHRRRLLFHRLKMDRSACTVCGSEDNEVTVRKTREGGGLLLSNLHTVCYTCLQ